MENILVTDDDTEFTELLCDYLGQQGFTATAVHNGREALNVLAAAPTEFDAMVLDIMMPELNGLDTLSELRVAKHSGSAIPVIMLTARGDDIDRIVGLELGADDYLPKPANPRELVARLRAILRRGTSQPEPEATKLLEHGDLLVDLGRREATLNNKPLLLTDSEFLLLTELLKNAGEIISKDALAKAMFGRELGPYDRSIDMHLSNLRRKLSDAADGGPERIKTVRNRGYQYLT